MGKRLAAAIICVLVLAAAAAGWAADEKLQFTNAGIYQATYELGDKGAISIKSLAFAGPTEEITAEPGIAFGVCCREISPGGQEPQANFVHPKSGSSGPFWGVETGFTLEGKERQRFYGFVFGQKSLPAPGPYIVNLFRADDGSLLASQLFTVVSKPEAPAAPEPSPAQAPAPAEEEKK